MLIPTMAPVDSPLDSVSFGLGVGVTASLVGVVGGADVDVVEDADETEAVVDDVVEVAVLESVAAREEGRIQK